MKDIILLGDREPEAITHRALDAVIASLPSTVRARWVGTDTREALHTADADAVWAVSGTPYRKTTRCTRRSRTPECADGAGVEAVELPEHPFFLATLFQAQIGTLHGRQLHQVIQGLVDAAVGAISVGH